MIFVDPMDLLPLNYQHLIMLYFLESLIFSLYFYYFDLQQVLQLFLVYLILNFIMKVLILFEYY